MFRIGTICVFANRSFATVEKILKNGHVRICWNGHEGSTDEISAGKLMLKSVAIHY